MSKDMYSSDSSTRGYKPLNFVEIVYVPVITQDHPSKASRDHVKVPLALAAILLNTFFLLLSPP